MFTRVRRYWTLCTNLAQDGYKPVQHSLGIWKHESRPITFCLCVDDFGIKYFNKADAQHLLTSLQKHYKVSTDLEGKKWDYVQQYVGITMPTYVLELLQKLLHKPTKQPQYSPHHYNPIVYGQKGKQQMATSDITPDILDKQTTRTI